MKKYWSIASLLLFFAISSCDSNTETTEVYYTEKFRPQVHFSPESQWMNDPNGMVYYDGEYHLFYQYYPDSTVWGPMHWGHAISTDLVHWEHLPIALYPDELGLIFSGSAVIDWNNTSGLQTGDHPPMIAIFTQHLMAGEKSGKNDFQVQSIAYSNDKGRSWQMYEGNPVIPNPGIRDFRDPKVFWHQESEKWVMIFAAGDRVKLYNSPDLKTWEFQSDFGADYGAHGGVWECPDLFRLPVEDSNESRWVMLVSINPGGPNGGSATQYFVGDFDGTTFTTPQASDDIKWLDYGRDNYAGVTWSDVPESDGRRLFIGWMSNWDYAQVVPTEVWRSAMTLTRSLHLERHNEEFLIASQPVWELEILETDSIVFGAGEIDQNAVFVINRDDQKTITAPLRAKIVIDLASSTSTDFGLVIRNEQKDFYNLGFKNNQLYSDRRATALIDFEPRFAPEVHYSGQLPESSDNLLTLDIILDHSSIEVFANDGQMVMTDLLFPENDFTEIYLFTVDGTLRFNSFTTKKLKSIWQP